VFDLAWAGRRRQFCANRSLAGQRFVFRRLPPRFAPGYNMISSGPAPLGRYIRMQLRNSVQPKSRSLGNLKSAFPPPRSMFSPPDTRQNFQSEFSRPIGPVPATMVVARNYGQGMRTIT